MNIVHVISSIDPQDGGPAVALAGLAAAQASAGLKVHVISTFARATGSQEAADSLRGSGVEVTLIGPLQGRISGNRQLNAILAREIGHCDVLHIHSIWEEIQHRAAVIARRLQKPYIFRPCGMLDPWSLRQGYWKKRIYLALRLRRDLNQAAALHFTTDVERDLTLPLQLRAGAIVEPNGIDLSEFKALPARGLFRQKFPEIGDRPIVLFLSRLHRKKGLDVLVPAFARAGVKDAVLVIAGPDENGYRAEIEALAQSLGLSGQIIFPGMLRGKDRIEALVDAQIFVLPSYQENFGIAVVEALAAGKPVLISDQVNLHGQISSHGLGEVLPVQVEAFTGAIQQWMDDGERCRQTGLRGRAMALETYDWRTIARRWSDHYQHLQTSNSPQGTAGGGR